MLKEKMTEEELVNIKGKLLGKESAKRLTILINEYGYYPIVEDFLKSQRMTYEEYLLLEEVYSYAFGMGESNGRKLEREES